MTETRQADLSNRALASRILKTYLAPRWKGLSAAVACTVVVAGLTGLLAQILDPAINKLIVRHTRAALLTFPLAIVALGLVRGLAGVGQAVLVNRIGHGLVGDIQVELFGKLVRADLSRLRNTHTGAFVSSVLYDAGLIREAATNGVIAYTQNGLIVVAMIAVMITKDVPLTLLVLVAGPLASAVMRRYARRSRKAARGAMAETSALSTAIMESLDGVRVVKMENREAYEQARVAAVVERRQNHIIKGANARGAAAPVTETLMTVVTAGVLAYAGWRASSGGMNVGAFTAFLVALGAAAQALRQLANQQTVMAEGLTAARRLFAALDVEPEVGEAPGAKSLIAGEATIRLEGVGFGYTAAAPALTDISIEVRRGERVALVGPSGGGKSTILNLIPRFYDVGAGRVSIDGQDVRDVTLASLRHHIALVTQEPFLFDDTVAANIAYARRDATPEEIQAAAEAAAAHGFIAALPKGYDTVVGEAGARLSGGQRQRIAIARAFVKNAPILLLDEATSALDTENEALVQAALDRLMAGRTTLLIAHRLSTVRHCDRIYVIEAGRVVETGTHAGLAASKGLYSRLARAQNLDLDMTGPAVAAGGSAQ